MKNGPQVEPAGRPVDCLGLTKRWSLVRHPAGCCGHFGELRVPARPPAGRTFLQTHRWAAKVLEQPP